LLNGQVTDSQGIDVPSLSLGIPPDYAPETDCFHEGIEMFRDRHSLLLKESEGNDFKRDLLMLGKQLRVQKLEELALAESEENNNDAIDEAEEVNDTETEEQTKIWTPESVADVMEGIVRYGAHLIRRARWFCLLSESSLAWQTGETAGRQQRLLVFQNGTILREEDMTTGQSIPSPPGYRKPFALRQHSFDVMTYDRLRVLTTELRRIVSDETDRQVRLRLSPNVVLGCQQLLNLLKYI